MHAAHIVGTPPASVSCLAFGEYGVGCAVVGIKFAAFAEAIMRSMCGAQMITRCSTTWVAVACGRGGCYRVLLRRRQGRELAGRFVESWRRGLHRRMPARPARRCFYPPDSAFYKLVEGRWLSPTAVETSVTQLPDFFAGYARVLGAEGYVIRRRFAM